MKRLHFLSCALILAGSVVGNSQVTSQPNITRVILIGKVYDVNHALIISGDVVAQGPDGKEYWATTNTEGVYKFELPSATYKIEANAAGFCPKRVEQFRVRRWLQSPLDFVLEFDQGEPPCAQKTMIKKKPPTRKPEIFRSIAE